MKRIIVYSLVICVPILFNTACKKTFNYDDFFKTDNGSGNYIDEQTGISYSSFYNEEFFFDINKIESVKIDRIYSDKGRLDRDSMLIFRDGIIISKEEERDYSSEVLYDYDEQGRLTTVKVAPDFMWMWTYTYPESNTRETWVNGECIETKVIFPEKNGHRIVETNKTGHISELIFYKKKGHLIYVRKKNSFLKSIREWILEYVDGNLNRIVEQYIRDEKKDIRYVETVVNRDDKDNVLKTEMIAYKNGDVDFIQVTIFSDYDSHGNWHKAERYNDKQLNFTTTRKIEYIDE